MERSIFWFSFALTSVSRTRFNYDCSLNIVRDSIGTGIYFVTYESVKQLLANARGTSPTHPLAVIVAGGMCGLVSWACVSHLGLTMLAQIPRADYTFRYFLLIR